MSNLSHPTLEQLTENKYISLKTFKRDRTAIPTTVWFVFDEPDHKIFMTTAKKASKLKRLRHTDKVEFAFCNARGKTHTQYFSGSCKELHEPENLQAHNLLKKKYGLIFKIWATFYLRQNARTYLEINF